MTDIQNGRSDWRGDDGQWHCACLRAQRLAGDAVRCGAALSGSRDWRRSARTSTAKSAKNKITADDKAATRCERIERWLDRAKLADCDFVVEAATEKFEIKAEIFRDLDQIAGRK